MSIQNAIYDQITASVDLGNGLSYKTSEQFDSSNLPVFYEVDKYSNNILAQITKENVTYNNGFETVNWTIDDKSNNNFTQGSYTIKH